MFQVLWVERLLDRLRIRAVAFLQAQEPALKLGAHLCYANEGTM